MSDLAALLDLPALSRITDITLPPLDHRRADRATTAHLQWMTVPDLVLGLLIDLTGTPLGDVIAIGEGCGAYGPIPRDGRRERLSALLSSWAVHYEGPEL